MASIIDKMRKQDALYWPRGPVDSFGRFTWGTVQQIKVRWDEDQELMTDSEGKQFVSKATIYVGQDMQTGDKLWLGLLADFPSETDLNKIQGVYTIRRWRKIPDLRNKKQIRIAII